LRLFIEMQKKLKILKDLRFVLTCLRTHTMKSVDAFFFWSSPAINILFSFILSQVIWRGLVRASYSYFTRDIKRCFCNFFCESDKFLHKLHKSLFAIHVEQ
jgi:hypothetical protein